jgi:SAM-dependent methyltransferase
VRPNLDGVNRETWSSPEVVSTFVRRSGFLDAGEERLLRRVADELRGQPLLDIGVGGGRTLPLLRELSDDYTGIDYSDELVAAARRRFPQARIEIGDARDLSRFATSHFALVFFSFNGIDGITHDERGQVFREVLRVLRPGGLFAYSTNNLDAPDTGIWRRGATQLLRNPRRALHYVQGLPRALMTRRRIREAQANREGWTQLVLPNYGLSLVLHHVSLANAVREATLTGFETVEVFDTDGKALAGTATSSSPWFHMLARAPQTKS